MRFAKRTLLGLILLLGFGQTIANDQPLKVGYSDWPGWVAWDIALEKGWFEEAGVAVEFEWFDYVASMDAFAAGQLDAVCMTNGDTLVTGHAGRLAKMLLINDYSNGNDMVVARPGIRSVSELKGKKIGVETGFVSHLLLLKALETAGMTEADVELVNVATNETPQVLASGDVDAIVAWQPNSSQALRMVPGSTAVYSSRDEPGLIYDVLAVAPESYANNPEAWRKVVGVWYRIVSFLADDATRAEGLSIMADRVGVSDKEYEAFFAGTRLLSRTEAQARYQEGKTLESIWESSRVADAFNVRYGVYKKPQNVEAYIDDSLYE